MPATKNIRVTEVVIVPRRDVRIVEAHMDAFLFVPHRQHLFTANSAMRKIWKKVEPGITRADLHAFAGSIGCNGAEIEHDLSRAEAIEYVSTADGPVAVASRAFVDLAGQPVAINVSGRRTKHLVETLLGHLTVPARHCDEQMVLVETAEHCGISMNGGDISWCLWNAAAPALKIALTDLVLERLDGLALHVATLSRDGGAILLVGPPTAGKSTLSAALDAAGFTLEGDDIAALRSDGRVQAFPFPITLKAGAWQLLNAIRPEIFDQPCHVRPDGQEVRYLPLDPPGSPPPREIACVFSLERSDDALSRLMPGGMGDAIGALLDGAWSQAKSVSPDQFEALVACLNGASFYRLVYSDIDDGIRLVQDAWQKASCETPDRKGPCGIRSMKRRT